MRQHENLSNEELITEKYVGIRPAPGYPACPDHTEKPALFAFIECDSDKADMINRKFCHAACVIGEWFLFFASAIALFWYWENCGRSNTRLC